MLMLALNEYKKFCYERDKITWEQSRMIAQSIIATAQAKENAKKQMMRSLKFPWDEEQKTTSLTKEKMEWMERISKEYHGGSK